MRTAPFPSRRGAPRRYQEGPGAVPVRCGRQHRPSPKLPKAESVRRLYSIPLPSSLPAPAQCEDSFAPYIIRGLVLDHTKQVRLVPAGAVVAAVRQARSPSPARNARRCLLRKAACQRAVPILATRRRGRTPGPKPARSGPAVPAVRVRELVELGPAVLAVARLLLLLRLLHLSVIMVLLLLLLLMQMGRPKSISSRVPYCIMDTKIIRSKSGDVHAHSC